MPDIKYEIEKEIAVLSDRNGYTKEVNLISWNGRKATIDIRNWNRNEDRMQKGITLSDEEVDALVEALQKYQKERDE